jgi:hypothetical protein
MSVGREKCAGQPGKKHRQSLPPSDRGSFGVAQLPEAHSRVVLPQLFV